MRRLSACLAPLLIAVMGTAGTHAQSVDLVPVQWQLQQVEFSYSSFTTAYACDALEQKVRDILVTLGAHSNTAVRVSGCVLNRPSRTAFVNIATAIPRPVADGARPAQPGNRTELLQRMDVSSSFDQAQFTATWKTLRLGQSRGLDLAPGDCELMAELRDHVLPKLGIKIVEETVNCTPHQLDISTPTLRVAALVPSRRDGQTR